MNAWRSDHVTPVALELEPGAQHHTGAALGVRITEVVVPATSARFHRHGMRQRLKFAHQLSECILATIARVDVEDSEPASFPGSDTDIRLGTRAPPPTDRFGIGGRVVVAMTRPRMFS